ncbi:MAG TPA: phenylalanine--tRNA ligase beta subunit-related protein [Candidatus Paceibacterota bacterium]|nr:phenylalanine--tRNA ligase beta subunit-related protein [Candidatus Paceibacterota bacterium]
MKVSREWLQDFFAEPLPDAAALADALTFGVAEIESIEEADDDSIIDVKVLPDRACYMLCHRGIAKELSVLLGLPLADDPLSHALPELLPAAPGLAVAVDDPARCPSYAAALLEGVSVGPSPAWLAARLARLGQRSINNVVDATNYVMLSLGTPLHAFDADKLSASGGTIGIRVRAARDGETVTALGGAEYALTSEMTVIADAHADAALAIAGIKGGTRAEVTEATTRIVLEAASFDPARTRRTSQALKLRTDASTRFEHGIADMLPRYGLDAVVALIAKIAGGELAGFAHADAPQPAPFVLGVSAQEANRRLGTALDDAALAALLGRLGFAYEKADDPLARVIALARSLEGAAYAEDSAMRFDAPRAFSCSSFTNYVYVHGAGLALPSISIDQYAATTPIEADGLAPGDLVFENTGEGRIRTETVQYLPGTPVPSGVDHVGMYLGEGMVIHASRNPGHVTIEPMASSPMFQRIVAYRRPLASPVPRFIVTAPIERLDLRTSTDLIEELGRVFGYANIAEQMLPAAPAAPLINPRFAYAEKLRAALGEAGFIETYTYSLRETGATALANALASDKSHLREDLASGLAASLPLNEGNLPLLGLDAVRLFEIGNVFPSEAEELRLGIAVRFPAGKKRAQQTREALEQARAVVSAALGTEAAPAAAGEETLEWNLSMIIPELAVPEAYVRGARIAPGALYKPFSPYPFVLRDIAAWTPGGTSADALETMIRETAGDLLVRLELFDQFSKDGRTSFAFHLVFQSQERTLSDQDMDPLMDRLYAAMREAGFETR